MVKKKVIINGDNYFQNAINDALNCVNIKNNIERILNTEPFSNQNNWEKSYFLSHQKDLKKFKENNKSIYLNILYVIHKTEHIRLAYKSKYNHKRNNQVILLMSSDGEKWHYPTVRSLPALLRGIMSNYNGDFYHLTCLLFIHNKK